MKRFLMSLALVVACTNEPVVSSDNQSERAPPKNVCIYDCFDGPRCEFGYDWVFYFGTQCLPNGECTTYDCESFEVDVCGHHN